MRKILFALLIVLIGISCRVNHSKSVKGNGKVITEERSAFDLSRIKIRGGINVELIEGAESLKVQADENLLRYIETVEEDGWLVVKTKKNVNLKSNHPIRVFVSTDRIRDINIAGSGNVRGDDKFSGADRLNIKIAGSGDVALAVNTPKVNVNIAGSGSVKLSGETRDAHVDIAGAGNYWAEDLMTENTDVDIKGSGDARVYADNTIDAKLMGSGTVYYRGKASINTKTAGSGKVKPM